MIRYTIPRTGTTVDTTEREALRSAIERVAPGWGKRAQKRTLKFARAGRYEESESIWSEVKPGYIDIQKNKCAFCERRFEDAQHNRIEFDLEHFRPKSTVACWPNPPRTNNFDYGIDTGAASDTGYYWLAYAPENYTASCKICNSLYKSSYFPITGARATLAGNHADLREAALLDRAEVERSLREEGALLCYPIGDIDDDPETLITFVATTAVPASDLPEKRRRGQIIIDFFGLNAREHLHLERAEAIVRYGYSLNAIADGSGDDIDLWQR
jgi:hypothetical protein